ncbi:MAG: GntR family transcriptional regulator [bacterium]|nr:GntR family transcriptional regulator [bacterium]
MPVPSTIGFETGSLLYRRVYDELSDWIADGILAPGERIRELVVARHLGISRTPVREAVRLLVADGLVRAEANRCPVVTEITAADIAHLIPIIGSLEALAIKEAVARMDEGTVKDLRRINRKLAACVAKEDHGGAAEANRAFHRAVIAAARNPELTTIADRVRIKVRRMGVFYFRSVGTVGERSVAEHKAIIDAVAAGNGGRGAALLERHWVLVKERLLAAAATRNDEEAQAS